MKTLTKSLNVFFSILLIAGALSVAMLAFPVFGNKALIVRSGSMEPTIGIGSLIVVLANQRLVPGDIIAFRSEKNPETIITHRISSIQKKGDRIFLKTKGDANRTIDGWEVSPKNIIGKNYLVIPEIGKLLSYARTKTGFLLLVITPALFVMLLEGLNIISEIRKKSKRKMESNLSTIPSFGFIEKRNPRPNYLGILVLLPVLVLGILVQNSFAFFSDTEVSTGNFFAAAESFGTPTPTPSVTPSPTPTPTPPGNGCANNNNNVVVVGGGTGSNTGAVVVNECNSTVNQNNSTTSNTTVNQSSTTGGNNSNSNTNNSNSTTTGNSSISTTVTTTSSTNSN